MAQTNVMHVAIPYGLSEAEMQYEPGQSFGPQVRLEVLRFLDDGASEEELRRIVTSAALILAKADEGEEHSWAALRTAITWERG